MVYLFFFCLSLLLLLVSLLSSRSDELLRVEPLDRVCPFLHRAVDESFPRIWISSWNRSRDKRSSSKRSRTSTTHRWSEDVLVHLVVTKVSINDVISYFLRHIRGKDTQAVWRSLEGSTHVDISWEDHRSGTLTDKECFKISALKYW